MVEYIYTHENVLWWLTVMSIITFVSTLIIVPKLVVRIPSDYFSHREHNRMPCFDQHPLAEVILLIGKNALGYIFIVIGIIMLVLPGQGLLTIVVGIMLLNFPGKYRLERWLISRRLILRSINWLRQRSNQNPLILD